MKTAVVTYIYPNGIQFLPDFLQTLRDQTDQHFELVIFNDAVDNAAGYFENLGRPVSIHPVSGTPVAIRFQSLPILANADFEGFIFQDIDDRMSNNRVAHCKVLLESHSLVCNNLVMMDAAGVTEEKGSWQNRLPDGFEFDYRFIADKNLVGLGNTATRRTMLNQPVLFHADPLAADWFVFYQLLYTSKATAVFTSACYTLYRQHDHNSAGLKQADHARLQQVLQVCSMHCSGLTQIGYQLPQAYLDLLVKTENLITQNHYFYNAPVAHQQLFWWEELNYLYEKN